MINHPYPRTAFFLLVIILVIFLFPDMSVAQSVKDSISAKKRIHALDDEAWNEINTNPGRSIVLAKNALELARKEKFKKEEATLLNTLGVALGNISDFQQALMYYDSALSLRRKIGDELGVASSLVNMSNIYFNQGLYDKSLICNLEGLKVYESNGKKKNATTVMINIGNIYQINKDYDLALSYFRDALKTSHEVDYLLGKSDAYIGLGNVFNYTMLYDSALNSYQKSLILKIKTADKIGMSRCYNNIGNVYKNLNQTDSAFYYFSKDKEISQEIGSDHLLAYALINLGDIFLLKDDLRKSHNSYSEAMEIADKLKTPDLMLDVYERLTSYYVHLGDYRLAFEYQEKQMMLNDSILGETKAKQIMALQTEYETEKKENQIQLLNKAGELQKAEIGKTRLLRNFFLIGFILILIIAALFYRNIQQRKQANRLLEIEKQNYQELNGVKDKLFSVISHDLRGPLTSLHGFLQLLENKNYQSNFETWLAQANTTVGHTLHLLDNLLYWSAGQVKGIVLRYVPVNMYDQVEEIKELFSFAIQSKNIFLENEIPSNWEVWADASCTRVVWRNLLSNAIKFSYPGGKIFISAQRIGDRVEFTIKDNGIGISSNRLQELFLKNRTPIKGTRNELGVGLGLILCHEFISKHGGKIDVESEPTIGTIFRFGLQFYSADNSSPDRLTNLAATMEE